MRHSLPGKDTKFKHENTNQSIYKEDQKKKKKKNK